MQAWGGPTVGSVANHIVPDTIFDNQLADYAPYKTPGNTGSVAQGEGGDEGLEVRHRATTASATRSACKNVLLIADTRAVDPKMVAVIEQDAAKIGITFKVRTINGAYPTIQTPRRTTPDRGAPGLGQGLRRRR